MTTRLWRLALSGWWTLIGAGCYGLASSGSELPSPFGAVAQDGASLALLFFISGAAWGLGRTSWPLDVRLLAAVVGSIVVTMAVIGWMLAAGTGFDRQLVLNLVLSATCVGAASRLIRRRWSIDTTSIKLELAAGPAALLLAVVITALTRAFAA